MLLFDLSVVSSDILKDFYVNKKGVVMWFVVFSYRNLIKVFCGV